MIGKWEGMYVYNQPKGFEDSNLNPVEFFVEIIAFENGSFSGCVEDNLKMGGTPGVGNILGTQSKEFIVFEKNMPIETIRFQNGEQQIRKNKKHPTLIYSGEINQERNEISGTWKFKKSKFMWIGLLPWWYSLGSGTFTMKKIDKEIQNRIQ